MEINKIRNSYFDFLRGIAILMVIGIHTYKGCGNYESLSGLANITMRQVLNCAVPIFLALSAFFIAKKDLSSSYYYLSFLKKQIPKVYIPCLIWSLPYFAMSILEGGNSFVNEVFKLFSCSYSIYYFIALIIQYYILLPILQRYNGKSMLILSLILSIISILIITNIQAINGIGIPLILYAGPFTTWFIFYMSGVYLSKYNLNYSLTIPISILVVGLVLSCIETRYLYKFHAGGVGIKLSSYIYSFGMILFLFSNKIQSLYKDNNVTNLITYIGRISFGLYLTHCFVIMVLDALPIPQIWIIRFVLTALIDTLGIMLAHRALPSKLNKYLGLQ